MVQTVRYQLLLEPFAVLIRKNFNSFDQSLINHKISEKRGSTKPFPAASQRKLKSLRQSPLNLLGIGPIWDQV